MKYFSTKGVGIGGNPAWSSGWNKLDVVIAAGNEVLPDILAAMVNQKRVEFPPELKARLGEKYSLTKPELSVNGRTIFISCGVYGGERFSLQEIRALVDEHALPYLEAAYKRINEIREAVLVLEEVGLSCFRK